MNLQEPRRSDEEPRNCLKSIPAGPHERSKVSNASLIRIETPRPGIRRIVMDRPERRHVVSPELRAEILGAVMTAEADSSIRAIVLTGSGGNFSGGGDLAKISKVQPSEFSQHMDALHRFTTAISNCSKPTIAAIEGVAAGSGVGNALAMDLIVAGKSAYFVFPFFKIGLIPDAGILYHLPRRVGTAIARRMLLSAQKVDAAEAERTGLADVVVPDDKVQEEALDHAERLAAQPAQAFRLTKRILASEGLSLADVLREEAAAQIICFQSPEFRAGVEAFLGKRK
jgi:2-(1,2-epoxy-1,2-dihydrophenyl)acetyl-CoA isomerase